MRLERLEALRSFALIGPGFGGEGWKLITPLRPRTDGSVWFAPYEASGAQALRLGGPVEAVEPTLTGGDALEPVLDEEGFVANVQRIREAIAAGDVYQVNLTLRARVVCAGGGALLRTLCRHGTPRFAAWVRLPGGPEFVSASPELLVEVDGDTLRAEPMKGTAPASGRAWLEASEKDAAELAMITDLVRDDFQRICVPRTVRVPSPRRFVTLPYVVQAVSDVVGRKRGDASVGDVLAQLHPGGSVTGAPRPMACALIRALERTGRGAYCGALGYSEGERTRFALLIRTATRLGAPSLRPAASARSAGDDVRESGESGDPEALRAAARTDALTEWCYGVGSGITWDSEAQAELAEVRLKLGALR